MADLKRCVISVLYVLHSTELGDSTYRGLQKALGLQSVNSVRTAVRHAREAGVVTVLASEGGAHCQAIVRLTGTGKELLRAMQLRRAREDGKLCST